MKSNSSQNSDKSGKQRIKNSDSGLITPDEGSRDLLHGKAAAFLVCCALVLLCFAIYGQTLRHGFINYDDGRFVTDNPQVQSGLSKETFIWAFTNHVESYFMPLSWLSHALDCQLFGLWGGGHHLTSTILHAVNSMLLFLLFLRLTGKQWPSAVVAALFAVHPLHVESVAWASERKDVLSTLFWCLTLLAYTHYVKRRGLMRYLLIIIFYALALMSKPMVVTLPCLLLLLDYWPLRRIQFDGGVRSGMREGLWLVLEKLPLFGMAVIDAGATILLQGRSGAAPILNDKSLPERLGNAAFSYVFFLVKFVFPSGLSVIYPWPIEGIELWKAVGAGILLAVLTAAALLAAKKYPYVITGWLWYLILMAPVMQVVQRHTFPYARADRYTYCALTGISVMIVWAVAEWTDKAPVRHPDKEKSKRLLTRRSLIPATLSGIFLASLAVCSVFQTTHWIDSVTLFQHAQAVTKDNYAAGTAIGRALQFQGRHKEAEEHFRAALKLQPNDSSILTSLSVALQSQGHHDEAELYVKKSLELWPDDVEALNNLGVILKQQGRYAESETSLRKALSLKPLHAQALSNLSGVLQILKQYGEAETCARKSLELQPKNVDALNNLGAILLSLEKDDEAEIYFRKALELDPNYPQALNNLGVVLLSKGNYEAASANLTKALSLKPDYVSAMSSLGMVLYAQGKTTDAESQLRKALALRPTDADTLTNLGIVLRAQGKEEDAGELFRQAVGINPDHVQALSTLGSHLLARGNYEEAKKHLTKALNIKPNLADALGSLGEIFRALGRDKDAIACFEKVLTVKPNSVPTLNNLAWMYATSKDPACQDGAMAVKHAGRAVLLISTQPADLGLDSIDSLAAAFARNGQFERAVETEQRALEFLDAMDGLSDDKRQELYTGFVQRLGLYGEKKAYVEETVAGP